jgi:hypothetical protein
MAEGSSLLLDETFASGDARFLEELKRFTGEKKLAVFAERFYSDARPFARRALLEYIDDGCDRDHHRVLVKRLFRLAEKAGDDEALAHFLCAFDRLARRRLVEVEQYNWPAGEITKVWVLRAVALDFVRTAWDPNTGKAVQVGTLASSFSVRTRRYLQRRAWRYFRRLGFRDPARYGKAIRAALRLYSDQHLGKAEDLLDAWGLVHALYRHSPIVNRYSNGIRLAPGRSLRELHPAPFCPDAWLGCRDELLALVGDAGARTVRAFALAELRAQYRDELRGLPISQLRHLLRSPHEEVQAFAAELLRSSTGLERLPIDEWLALLRLENPIALPIVCELVELHVAPERLSVEACIELACARPQAVAALGLRWLRDKAARGAPSKDGGAAGAVSGASPKDGGAAGAVSGGVAIETLLALAAAEAPPVRAEAIAWVLERIAKAPDARPEQLRELVDARHEDVRVQALATMDGEARFRESPALWAALPESPYDDVRAHLVARLEAHAARVAPGSLPHVWATALLAVHRGGKQKPQVARQIAARAIAHPDEAPSLLPLLAIALRSLRVPERCAALAALVRAAERRPGLGEAIARHLPELKIFDDAAAARASTGGAP